MKNLFGLLAAVGCVFVSGTVSAGAIGGPKGGHSTVNPRTQDVFNITLAGNSPAVIRLTGSAAPFSGELDCFLLDPAGKLVDSDQSPGNHCELMVIPEHTGNYRLLVRNVGGLPDNYEWVSN